MQGMLNLYRTSKGYIGNLAVKNCSILECDDCKEFVVAEHMLLMCPYCHCEELILIKEAWCTSSTLATEEYEVLSKYGRMFEDEW